MGCGGAGGFVSCGLAVGLGAGFEVGGGASVMGMAVGDGSSVGSSVGSGVGVLVACGRGVNVARAARVTRLVAVGSACEKGRLLPRSHAIITASAAIEKSSIETMRFHLNAIKRPPKGCVRGQEKPGKTLWCASNSGADYGAEQSRARELYKGLGELQKVTAQGAATLVFHFLLLAFLDSAAGFTSPPR